MHFKLPMRIIRIQLSAQRNRIVKMWCAHFRAKHPNIRGLIASNQKNKATPSGTRVLFGWLHSTLQALTFPHCIRAALFAGPNAQSFIGNSYDQRHSLSRARRTISLGCAPGCVCHAQMLLGRWARMYKSSKSQQQRQRHINVHFSIHYSPYFLQFAVYVLHVVWPIRQQQCQHNGNFRKALFSFNFCEKQKHRSPIGFENNFQDSWLCL